MPNLELLIKADDQATQKLDKMQAALEKAGKSAKSFGEKATSAGRSAKENLKVTGALAEGYANLGLIMSGVFGGVAAAAVFRFLKSSFEEFSKHERVVRQLDVAMRNMGVTNRLLLKDQVDYASALQNTTAFADDNVIALQAQLTSFGLFGDELKRATKAAVDFASFTGRDLNLAALTVGKAFAGQTGELGRYGIIIDANIPKAKQFEAVLSQLEKRFGGTAQEDARTYTGRVEQLKNKFGDLQELVGQQLTPALDVYGAELSRSIDRIAEIIIKVNEEKSVNQLAIDQLEKEIQARASAAASLSRYAQGVDESTNKETKEIEMLQRRIEALKKDEAQRRKTEESQAKADAEKAKREAEERKRIQDLAQTEKERKDAQEKLRQVILQVQQDSLMAVHKEKQAQQQAILAEGADRIRQLEEIRKVRADMGAEIDQAVVDSTNATAAKLQALDLQFDQTAQAVKQAAGDAGEAILSGIGDSLASSIVEGKNFEQSMRDVFQNVLREAISAFTQIAIRAALIKVGILAATGGAGGGFLSFDEGTQRVPGPLGAPTLAVVHGGETVSRPGSAGAGSSGGGGGGTTQNIIYLSLHVADLNPAERERVASAMADALVAKTGAGRKFVSAMNTQLTAIQQSKVNLAA